MIKKLLLVALFFSITYICEAQFALGDIAFSAYNADTTGGGVSDAFTFVLLRDVSSGEQISFTENGWFAVGGFRVAENTCTLTFGANYFSGTQIVISAIPFQALDENGVSAGTLSGAAFSLASGGDQIFAYDPANVPSAGDESGFVAAIHMNGAWDADATSSTTSAKPSVFTDGVNSISISPEVDNARVSAANCSNFSDTVTLRTMLNTTANWETNNDTAYNQSPPLCIFPKSLSTKDHTRLASLVRISPNPSNDKAFLNYPSDLKPESIVFYSITGSEVKRISNDFDRGIDITNLNSGLYLVKIKYENTSIVKKLIKN